MYTIQVAEKVQMHVLATLAISIDNLKTPPHMRGRFLLAYYLLSRALSFLARRDFFRAAAFL